MIMMMEAEDAKTYQDNMNSATQFSNTKSVSKPSCRFGNGENSTIKRMNGMTGLAV